MENIIGEVEEGTAEISTADFPVDALPGPMAKFVEQAAAALPAPADLVALPAIVAAGSAIGNSVTIKAKEGWIETAAIYGVVVADPGSKKSPAQAVATAPIMTRDTGATRTWTGDVTMERHAELLHQNPRGVAVFREEIAGWIKSLNQYKGGKGADKEFYLSAWSGVPQRVDRKNGTDLFIPRPFISLVGGVPTAVLLDIASRQVHGDGFLERMLFAFPESVPIQWTSHTITAQVRMQYGQMIDALYDLPYQDPPAEICLNDEATEYFVRWHDSHFEEMDAMALSNFVRGAYAKLAGYCLRLALIHALCEDPHAHEVPQESVAAAAALIYYFKFQCRRVDGLISSGRPDPVERCKTLIRSKLSACRSVVKRDLQRLTCSHYPAVVFNQALDDLRRTKEVIQEGGVIAMNRA